MSEKLSIAQRELLKCLIVDGETLTCLYSGHWFLHIHRQRVYGNTAAALYRRKLIVVKHRYAGGTDYAITDKGRAALESGS